MALIHSMHQGHAMPQLRCSHATSRCLSSRSRPQISLTHRPVQRTGLYRPTPQHARDQIFCSASSQTLSAGSAKPLRFIQHKEEAFWFYRFLSIVYDHIGDSRCYLHKRRTPEARTILTRPVGRKSLYYHLNTSLMLLQSILDTGPST